MIRTSLLLGVLLAGTAVPAAAQGAIRPGQTVQGELSSADPVLEDDTHYDVWRFRGQAGHVYAGHAALGRLRRVPGRGIQRGARLRRLRVRRRRRRAARTRGWSSARAADGRYEIRANSLSAGETGAYTLELQDLGEGEHDGRKDGDVAAMPIRAARAVQRRAHGGRRARRGRLLLRPVRVPRPRRRGSHHQPELGSLRCVSRRWGAWWTAEFEELESNDDGPSGTDSFLRITLPEDGEYLIRANSLSGGETGAYTLRLTRG